MEGSASSDTHGEDSASSDIQGEGSLFSDIHGEEILLQQRSYSDTCREFTVVRPKLSLRSLTSWTCAVWLAAYLLFLYTDHTAVLSAAILCSLLGLVLHLHLVRIDEESLLVLGSLGLQKRVTYGSGRESCVFLEMCRVQDVIINEAISGYTVHYYLCILIKGPQGPSQVIPVFRGPQPRLDCLVEIYQSCQEILSRRKEAGRQ